MNYPAASCGVSKRVQPGDKNRQTSRVPESLAASRGESDPKRLKRPDIALFCQEPSEEEEAITLVPEAVIKVISKGYEAKDLEIEPRFYLSQGVKDVVVFDPYTLLVLHLRRDKAQRLVSPVALHLECGCSCTV